MIVNVTKRNAIRMNSLLLLRNMRNLAFSDFDTEYLMSF